MTDNQTDSDINATIPSPEVKKKSGPSLVWLVPLITAIIGGWLIIKTLSEKGPEITITFKSAEGIESGKTKIKYKEIEIGVVDSVHFSKDFSNVILKVSIAKEAALFLRRDTRFWVVKPRLSMRGVSNLSTLLSGVYIEIEPGHGAPHKNFVGLEVAPVIKADVPGRKITLLAKNLGSIDTGSSIYYQGVLAGEVLGYELGTDRRSVFIHTFIKAPYDELVQSNTRFWNVSGIDVEVGTEGIKVRSESLQSIIFGGIAFDTPLTLERVKKDIEGLVFTLYDNFESIKEESFVKKIIFILFFKDSVRGLNMGAPVEFKGIKIGSVVDLRLEFDRRDSSFRIPVLIEIEPQRIIDREKIEVSSPYETLKGLVDHGLRARLQTGSLLTGQLLVELGMHPDTPIHLENEKGPYPELPTIPAASFEQITNSVKNILAKVEKVDLDKIGAELLGALQQANRLINSKEIRDAIKGASRLVNSQDMRDAIKGASKLVNSKDIQETIKGANKLINSQEIKDTISNLKESLHSFKSILHKLDKRAEPIAMSLEKALWSGHRALEDARVTMGLVNKILKPDSPLQFRFNQLTEEMAETARSIRTLLDMLERNPNSIIFGKKPSGGK